LMSTCHTTVVVVERACCTDVRAVWSLGLL
jgi:hypothetical protein